MVASVQLYNPVHQKCNVGVERKKKKTAEQAHCSNELLGHQQRKLGVYPMTSSTIVSSNNLPKDRAGKRKKTLKLHPKTLHLELIPYLPTYHVTSGFTQDGACSPMAFSNKPF